MTKYWNLIYYTLLITGWLVAGVPVSAQTTLDSEESAFLSLLNNLRTQYGLTPLQISPALEASSTWMSTDMATRNYAGHTDSLGRDPFTRMKAFGYNYPPWGENIAAGNSDAQNTLNQWLTACDPDGSGSCTYAHRQNMLNGSFKAIGIGRAYNPNSLYRWYWTTDFGGYVDAGSTIPKPAAPTIGFFAATPATIGAGQSAILSWSISGAGTVTIDPGVGNVSSANSVQVSPSETTSYLLTATNDGGSVTARTSVTVSAATDSQAPSAPALVSAVASSATRVDLVWTASTDNIGVTGYQILRSGSVLTAVSGNTLTYADVNASPGTTYTYSVRAYDAAGNYSNLSNTAAVITPPVVFSTNCPAPATNAFTGCYYPNRDLTGGPVLVRTESQVNFDWGNGSPDRSLSAGNFSVRWQGNFNFDSATYTFTAITSDGMRVYIDGNIVLDRWRDQPPYMYYMRPTLTQGSHLITVEYYEHTGGATASLAWQSNSPVVQPPVISSFTATPATIGAGQPATLAWSVSGATTVTIDNGVGNVSNTTSKSVSPAQTTTYWLTATNAAGTVTARTTVVVSTGFDTEAPTAPVIVAASARSAGAVDLGWLASTDNIGVTGYQVIRDGAMVASLPGNVLSYSDTGVNGNTGYMYAVRAFDAAGNYSNASNAVRVTTPAAAPTSGTCPAPATGAFTGCYYGNIDLAGVPVFVRTDNQINFDWWTTGPAGAAVPVDNFSVRWQGNFNFDEGTYTFTTISSDGVRLYIDGNIVLDRWRDQPPYGYVARRSLSAGNHLVTLEYYDHTGSRSASLSWQKN